ncbi:MAG: heme-binding protein [Devosia sp.]
MSSEADIEKIVAQEQGLVFERFDEDIAFALVGHVRDAANAAGKGIAVGVYLWDRSLCIGMTAGASSHNLTWAERKVGTVRLLHKSSYRLVLERGDKPRLLEPSWAADPASYAIAGGAFPIHVKGLGFVGAISTSGLPERDDHGFGVAAVCAALGRDPADWMLRPA